MGSIFRYPSIEQPLSLWLLTGDVHPQHMVPAGTGTLVHFATLACRSYCPWSCSLLFNVVRQGTFPCLKGGHWKADQG